MMMRYAISILAIGCSAWAATPPAAQDSLNRFLRNDQSSCRDADRRMQIQIQASLPKMQKEGAMDGLKVISKSGVVAYRFLRFTGDKLIKTDVIARFLTAEAQPPEKPGDMAISEKNYKFKFKRTVQYQGSAAQVFQLSPRKKSVGLYKGELWLDASSGAPVREEGSLVKSPSIFIRRVNFVREYAQQNAKLAYCGQPERMSVTVQTRLVGDAELVVRQHPADDASDDEMEEPAN